MAVDTKDLILDVAEAMIAERGIDAVSLREITTAANVNLAAVHYHFGSKEALVQKVFERRIRPVNAARLAMLDESERRAGESAPAVEDILRAFIAPAVRLGAESGRSGLFRRVCGRVFAEPSPSLQAGIDDFFTEVVERFGAAFVRALPGLEQVELCWRMHFMVGAMVHTLMEHERLQRFTRGLCTMDDPEALIERLVGFTAAGMRAEVARPREESREVPQEAAV